MEESSTCCKHSQPENTEPVALKGSIAPSMCHEDGNIESLPHLLLTDLGFNQPNLFVVPENRKWNVTSGKYQGFFLRVHFEFQIYIALALPTAQYVHSSPAKNIPNEIAATFYIWLGKRNTSKTKAAWVQSRKLMCQSIGTTSSMNA